MKESSRGQNELCHPVALPNASHSSWPPILEPVAHCQAMKNNSILVCRLCVADPILEDLRAQANKNYLYGVSQQCLSSAGTGLGDVDNLASGYMSIEL
jgi:hypothetical protein